MATILFGYDVENADIGSDITSRFLDRAYKVHGLFDAPCTLFTRGQTLETNVDAFKKAAEHPDIFDIQSHTYSHYLLKTVCAFHDGITEIWRGGSIPKIRAEVRKSVETTRKLLGLETKGLCGPYCYYRGLSDRPEILEILHDYGIRFLRTWGRDQHDWQPVDMSVQPFWYDVQGFPDMLETPVQGWQDCIWRQQHGWHNLDGFVDYECSLIDEAMEKDCVTTFIAHDWSSLREDPEMTIVERVLAHAKNRGIKVMSYMQYYEEQAAIKGV